MGVRETPIDSVEALVRAIEAGFWRKYAESAAFRDALKGKDRDIHLGVPSGESWRLVVRDGRLVEVARGAPARPDVVILATEKDLLAVANRELHPVRAYLERRVQVKAPLKDILLVRGFVGK